MLVSISVALDIGRLQVQKAWYEDHLHDRCVFNLKRTIILRKLAQFEGYVCMSA